MIRLSGTKKKRKIGHEKTLKWRVELILISWLAVLGFDFLLHAGLLARVYARESPALLSAEHAFYRIPFGYLSYLILVVLIFWVLSRFGVNDWKKGLWTGIKLGALIEAAFAVGMYSITKIDLDMLLGWGLGQIIVFGIAGGLIGAAYSGTSLKKLMVMTAIFVAVMVVLIIVLQSLGLVPPIRLAGE